MPDPFDLLLRGATLIRPSGIIEADIGIRGARIAALLQPGRAADSAATLDVTGLHALPGAIDCHVHFRDPGMPEAEDWGSGSAAAVAGGVTAVFDMPNTNPPTTTAQRALEKIARAQAASLCDFGVYGAITAENLDDLQSLAQSPIVGFKCYIGPSTGGLTYPGDTGFTTALRVAAAAGLRVAVHAEDEALIDAASAALLAAGRTDAAAWAEARPAESESRAAATAIAIALQVGARLHLCHVSAAATLPFLAEAHRRGQDVTSEITPHHLALDDAVYASLGTLARVNPPIRSAADRVALTSALATGLIDLVGSDHAPHSLAVKQTASIWQAASGLAGVQLQLPLLLRHAQAGLLSLTDVPLRTAQRPAEVWGLTSKGRLEIGFDADITLFDLSRLTTISESWLRGRSSNVAFLGWEVPTPIYTLVRGRTQFAEGAVIGAPLGRNLAPSRNPAVN